MQEFFKQKNKRLSTVVVIGSESGGKSSVVEALIGHDFLPEGIGIVTRCPIVINLHQLKINAFFHKNGNNAPIPDFAVFGHLPGKKFENFEDVRNEIVEQTNVLAGFGNDISDEQIILDIYSSKIVDLTIINLPAIEKSLKLINEYISNDNTIILAVTRAVNNFNYSESVKLARKIDPNENRTICVLIKIDLLNGNRNAIDIPTKKFIL
uniref:Dynamin-type G domain-containing protein n=1 Tax=Panagrolaimus sp. JU765 TaxID=591449 RepID=A0AC34PVJ7_9BILA